MKNLSLKALALFLLIGLSNVSSFARIHDDNVIKIQSRIINLKNSLNFNVFVKNAVNTKVFVNIKDEFDNYLYSEKINSKTGKFQKTFDLNDLADGNYKIEVIGSDNKVIETKSFNIESNENRSLTVK